MPSSCCVAQSFNRSCDWLANIPVILHLERTAT